MKALFKKFKWFNRCARFKPLEFAREHSEVSSPRKRGGGQRRWLNGWNGSNGLNKLDR